MFELLVLLLILFLAVLDLYLTCSIRHDIYRELDAMTDEAEEADEVLLAELIKLNRRVKELEDASNS